MVLAICRGSVLTITESWRPFGCQIARPERPWLPAVVVFTKRMIDEKRAGPVRPGSSCSDKNHKGRNVFRRIFLMSRLLSLDYEPYSIAPAKTKRFLQFRFFSNRF